MSNIFEIITNFCISKRNKAFADYVEGQRGWTKDTIDQWQIGSFPSNCLLDLRVRIASENLNINAFEDAHIISNYGIKGYSSKFFNRIIFPVRNEYGEHIAITGRSLDANDSPKYYNTDFSKGSNLYGLDMAKKHIREKNIVYVFEGNADVVTAHQYNVKNSVAFMGTAFSEEHIIALSGYTKNIVLVFDNDTAGKKAMASFNEKKFDQKRKGITIFRSSLRNGKDADEFIKNNGGEAFVNLTNDIITNKMLQSKLRLLSKEYTKKVVNMHA